MFGNGVLALLKDIHKSAQRRPLTTQMSVRHSGEIVVEAPVWRALSLLEAQTMRPGCEPSYPSSLPRSREASFALPLFLRSSQNVLGLDLSMRVPGEDFMRYCLAKEFIYEPLVWGIKGQVHLSFSISGGQRGDHQN